jgi:hypothetical protein
MAFRIGSTVDDFGSDSDLGSDFGFGSPGLVFGFVSEDISEKKKYQLKLKTRIILYIYSVNLKGLEFYFKQVNEVTNY